MSETLYLACDTPVGTLYVGASDGAVVSLRATAPTNGTFGENDVLRTAARQLGEYFAGARRAFDVPIRLAGTAFQHKVWDSLLALPYGATVTYGEIARSIGAPNAARAVGNANGANPICVIVPCHRVVAAHGLGGYAYGLPMKEYLLALEGGKI